MSPVLYYEIEEREENLTGGHPMIHKDMPIKHTIFTPIVPEQSESNVNALKTGTTTVAIIYKDGVVMAADKRATAGHMIVDKKIQKVLPVTKNTVVTTAGSVSDIQLLYKYLGAELRVKRLRAGREATVKEGANLLAGWVYNIIRSSYGIAHFLVGGYDEKPQLFDVYPDGSITEVDDFVSSGSGSVFALGVLESQYKKNMTQEDAVQLIVKSISAALARDSASGNGIDVFVIDKNGARKVLTKMISSALEQ